MSAAKLAPTTLMAFDFGARRIGVAVGNALINTSNALTTVHNSATEINWPAIDDVIKEWQPDLIIIGLPLMLDGTPSTNAAAVEQFAAEVAERCGCNVLLVDEKLSSAEAKAHIREARRDGRRGRTQSGDIDKFAAEVILRTWLNHRGGQAVTPAAH